MVWPSLDFVAHLHALCMQARARHVCACWRHAAGREKACARSYSSKTMHPPRWGCMGRQRCVESGPRARDGAPVVASAARMRCALWRRTAASGEAWGPSYLLVYLSVVQVCVGSGVRWVMTTWCLTRACMRISCAHVLRTLAVNGSVWGGLQAELFIGLPRVTPHSAVTQVCQLWISSLTLAPRAADTCTACVRMLAPRGKARGTGVVELFTENHAPCRWVCMWCRGCVES